MMLFACLILLQSSAIMVVADKRKFEAFAPLNRIRNRRASDDKTAVLDAWEIFELFELSDEGRFVLCRHFRLELEENYDPAAVC